MSDTDAENRWREYREAELARATPVLTMLGFVLEERQPHLGGERALMQAVTTQSGRKLILLGRRIVDGKRAVIKVTSDQNGAQELRHERACRLTLEKIAFAYKTFASPEEILFLERAGLTISVSAFIDQESAFLDRPLTEQFTLALTAFKAQESAHATTHAHRQVAAKNFGAIDALGYLHTLEAFAKNIDCYRHDDRVLAEILSDTRELVSAHLITIERYCGFLTHIDFVPHNIRVHNGTIYLLDHSSLRFGNKYEGWARFLNFMTLYNPKLEHALMQYVRDNRTPEEVLSLKLMRVYRLAEILWYYTRTLPDTRGNLHTLNEARVHLWSYVLRRILDDQDIEEGVLDAYRQKRNTLRSDDEKRRQVGLH